MSTQFSHARYERLVKATFDEVTKLSKLKGGEYSGDDDRLLNFRRNGLALGLRKETVWGVYAAKHWDALMQYIKDQQYGKDRQRMESLGGRCDDLIVYLILFKAMLQENGGADGAADPMKGTLAGTTPSGITVMNGASPQEGTMHQQQEQQQASSRAVESPCIRNMAVDEP